MVTVFFRGGPLDGHSERRESAPLEIHVPQLREVDVLGREIVPERTERYELRARGPGVAHYWHVPG